MRGYVGGPMTGLPMYNFPAFFAAEDRLEAHGHQVVNPARHDEDMGWVTVQRDEYGGILTAVKVPASFDWTEALGWDLKQLERCDFLYLLPGWSRSRGACKEYAFAKEHGLLIWGAVDEAVAPTDSQPLVGLVGYAQSGKDTFAGMLGYRRIAFADPLKALALACDPTFSAAIETTASGNVWQVVFGLREAVANQGWEYAKAEVPGVREFLQNLGVGVRDILGADTWVEAAFAGYDPSQPTVFTDVRFPNEIEAIRGRGGVIVRIDRPSVSAVNSHVSEFAWQATEPDYIISNGGDLVDLKLLATDLDWTLR